MKVDNQTPVVPTTTAPAAAQTKPVEQNTLIAPNTVPVVGAAKAPPVAAPRDADDKLRSVLSALKDNVSPKSIDLAINKLRTHARSDVRDALQALRDGAEDAIDKHLPKNPLDFARAEMKEIASKLKNAIPGDAKTKDAVAGVVKTVADFGTGVGEGMNPLPLPKLEAPFGHSEAKEAGKDLGVAIGLVADASALVLGMATTGGGGLMTPTGVLTAPGLVLDTVGPVIIGASVASAKGHLHKLTDPSAPATFEARAVEPPPPQPTSINEQHIFKGEVKTAENGERVATGHHLEGATGHVKIIESTRSKTDSNGVFKARVEMLDRKSGNWIEKKQFSTFFPDSYSAVDARRAISEAFGNRLRLNGDLFSGLSARGIRVLMAVDELGNVTMAYPLMEL